VFKSEHQGGYVFMPSIVYYEPLRFPVTVRRGPRLLASHAKKLAVRVLHITDSHTVPTTDLALLDGDISSSDDVAGRYFNRARHGLSSCYVFHVMAYLRSASFSWARNPGTHAYNNLMRRLFAPTTFKFILTYSNHTLTFLAMPIV
jgi:hypothetical protein